jgi:hypothetical protein
MLEPLSLRKGYFNYACSQCTCRMGAKKPMQLSSELWLSLWQHTVVGIEDEIPLIACLPISSLLHALYTILLLFGGP